MNFASKSEFESLFKLHYSRLVHYASRMLNDADGAEDAVQQVFVRLWEKKDVIEVEGKVESYLLRSVHNACLNKLKHEQTKQAHAAHVKHAEQEHFEHDSLESEEFKLKVRAAVHKLPTECRRIFLLSRIHGKKYHQIADELNLSVKTVENQMGKALRIMRSELQDEIKETMRILKTIFWLGIGVKLAAAVIRYDEYI